jgi:hypothetical protein
MHIQPAHRSVGPDLKANLIAQYRDFEVESGQPYHPGFAGYKRCKPLRCQAIL